MRAGPICFLNFACCLTFCVAIESCSSLGVGKQTPQERADYLEPMLSAAGFDMIPANTPDKMAHLKTLPPLKVSYYDNKEGELRYWFADPDYCHCLYLGSQTEYQKFQDLRLQERMVRSEQEAADENYETSQQMQMDPFGGFGWGPGIGFSF